MKNNSNERYIIFDNIVYIFSYKYNSYVAHIIIAQLIETLQYAWAEVRTLILYLYLRGEILTTKQPDQYTHMYELNCGQLPSKLSG